MWRGALLHPPHTRLATPHPPAAGALLVAARWRDGIFLGMLDTSNEYFAGTREGVFKTRSIQLKPESQKHDAELLQAITGTPWQMVPGREAALVQPLPAIVQPLPLEDAPRLPRPLAIELAPKQLYIRKAELMKHGYTPGCPRCDGALAGKSSTATHTEECRKRIEAAIAADPEANVRLEAAESKRTARLPRPPRQKAQSGQSACNPLPRSGPPPTRLVPPAGSSARSRERSQHPLLPLPLPQPLALSSARPETASLPADGKRQDTCPGRSPRARVPPRRLLRPRRPPTRRWQPHLNLPTLRQLPSWQRCLARARVPTSPSSPRRSALSVSRASTRLTRT